MPERIRERTLRVARLGALLALSLALFILEAALLPLGLLLPLPGAKLGLANLAALAALELDGLPAAAAVTILRVLLAAVFGGTLGSAAFWLSLGGSLAALAGMGAARRLPGISLVGISVIGAVCHNLGQLGTLHFVLPNTAVLYFLPWLVLLGIPAGLLTGFLARRVMARLG